MKLNCSNENCLMKLKCLKYTRPNKHIQFFAPENNTAKNFKCKYLIEN